MITSIQIAETCTNRMGKRLAAEKKVLQEELKTLPKGKLYLRERGASISFMKKINGKQIGISGNPEEVIGLARRRYIEEWLLSFDAYDSNDNDALSEIIEKLKNTVDDYESAGINIENVLWNEEQQTWNANRSSEKPTRRSDLKFPSKGGIKVRSKSEQMIADLLEELHIPYRYEPLLLINGTAYYPDFAIMLPDNSIVILEHFGRMDDEGYIADMLNRIKAYNKVGILIGRNLFMSFENDTSDERLAKEVLFQVLAAPTIPVEELRDMVDRACHQN